MHTLAQNCHCEFCCGVHLTWKNNPVTPDRKGYWKAPKNSGKLPSPKPVLLPSPMGRKRQTREIHIAKTVRAKKSTSGWHPSVWRFIETGKVVLGLATSHDQKVKSLQARRDDQSRYPHNSWAASLAVDSWVGHCPLLKPAEVKTTFQSVYTGSKQPKRLEVLHIFRWYTHTHHTHTSFSSFTHNLFTHNSFTYTRAQLSRTLSSFTCDILSLSHTHAWLCHKQPFHTQLCNTQLFHTQLFTHTHNFFTRNFFTQNTFTYNSFKPTILHHLLCLSCLLRTASTEILGRSWLVGLSGALVLWGEKWRLNHPNKTWTTPAASSDGCMMTIVG